MPSSKKVLISILLGLAGFAGSFYPLYYIQPPFNISIEWCDALPLLAGMAFGGRYALIAATLGLGAFYPLVLWPNDGWACVVTSLLLVLAYSAVGYFTGSRRRKAAFWNHPVIIYPLIVLIYNILIRILFPIAFSFNPPFWNPAAELSIPAPILDGIIAKSIIILNLLLIFDYSLLKIPFIRKLFGLEIQKESRNNGWIVLGSFVGCILLWYVSILFNRIFIDQTFPQEVFQIRDPHEILTLIVFLSAGFFMGSILCQYVESRLKAEEELGKSRENYRQIFEQAADGIFIADAQGNYVDVNESGCKMTGYTRQEFLQLNLRDVVMAEEQKEVPLRINEVNAGEIVVFERRMRHKTGSPIEVEISARKLADGRLQGLVRDISQRKRAEDALWTNNQLFTQFLRHSPIYAYIKEVTPTRSLVLQASENYVDMVGIPGSQMAGKDMYELFPAEFAGKMTADDWSVVAEGRVLKLDEELNGRSYTTIKFPIRYGDKTFLAGYTIDITETKAVEKQVQADQVELRRLLEETELSRRALLSLVEDQKEAEEQIRRLNAGLEQRVQDRTAQLAAANHELEAFAHSVSHDLRAPLRALDGFSNALLTDYGGQLDEQGQHFLHRIQEAARRMDQLINDLLDLSRVNRAELKYQPVNLSALARQIADDLAAQAPERAVEFEIAQEMHAKADPNLIKIALENLLNNAFKFTSKCARASIRVGVIEQAGEWVYFVADNGAGFAMEYAHKLFTPFHRLHNVGDFPGTGIGLSIVHRIITRHGGRIWPEAQAGQGATFYFTLGGSEQ